MEPELWHTCASQTPTGPMVCEEGKFSAKRQCPDLPTRKGIMEKVKSALKVSPWPGNILKSDRGLGAIRITEPRFLLQRAARQHTFLILWTLTNQVVNRQQKFLSFIPADLKSKVNVTWCLIRVCLLFATSHGGRRTNPWACLTRASPHDTRIYQKFLC